MALSRRVRKVFRIEPRRVGEPCIGLEIGKNKPKFIFSNTRSSILMGSAADPNYFVFKMFKCFKIKMARQIKWN